MDRKSNKRKRILYIDDQPVCWLGLRHLLTDSPNFYLQGYRDSVESVRSEDLPDIVAIDIAVARSRGITVIKDLRRRFPKASVLVLTSHDELLFAERCLKAGAKGYLMKTANEPEILSALDDVANGNLHISQRLRSQMLQRLTSSSESIEGTAFDVLSDRELLIVQHIGLSKNNREIADALEISIKTIESHRSRIKSKLGLATPNELVRLAMRLQSPSRYTAGIDLKS